ncbi:biotin transporter BioY [Evansella tamaricis]|uniref:Biotin transporter n=1 Tax=Evansella tamaricis TaxID=2069301 RepID=A0ABS6JFW1_9BACI|nr:biotin transporter BioY [Evansella tamaricis]MBU9712577.1 biotin transporter BioY [Evansella tamaricis]
MVKKINNPFTVVDLTKAAMFIALMGIGANLTAFITIGIVPLTFQTVIAILAGVILGKKVGTFSMLGYTIVGLIGAPVFSGFQGGMHNLVSPTFGFILSFIALTFVVGFIIEKTEKPSLIIYVFASYMGLVINYLIGVPYLFAHQKFILEIPDVTLLTTSILMAPFFVKDIIVTGLGAVIAPKIIKATNSRRSNINQSKQTA